MQATGAGAHQRADIKGSDTQDRSGEGEGLTDHSIYISLPVAVMRYSDKDNLRETELILAYSLRSYPSWLGSQGTRSLGSLVTLHPESGSRAVDKPQIQRTALSTVQRGLLTSVDLIKISLQAGQQAHLLADHVFRRVDTNHSTQEL